MNKTEKEGAKHHGNVGRTALSKFKMWKFVDKQYRLLWVGQGSRTDYVILEKRARYEMLQVLSACSAWRGGFLVVLVRGYTAGQGRRRPPGSSCPCSGKKPAFPLKGSWHRGQGRTVVLSGAHLFWGSKVTAHSVTVVIFLAHCTIPFLFFSPLEKRISLLDLSLRELGLVNWLDVTV